MSDTTTGAEIESLLRQFAAGDALSKDALIAFTSERLRAVARGLLRNFGGEARVEMWSVDLVAEVYPRLSKALDELKPESAPQFFGLVRLQMERALTDKVRAIEGRKNPIEDEREDDEVEGEDGSSRGRSGKRPRVKPLSDFEREDSSGFTPPSGREGKRTLAADLLAAISKLPEKEAYVALAKLASKTHREIADELGVHEDTVDSYWSKARTKLGRTLSAYKKPD